MHLQTSKNSIAAPLGLVFGAADFRGSIPILGTVLLRTANGKLSMICSDTAVLARGVTECEVKNEGAVAVDARRLQDLVKAVPDKEEITLRLDDKVLLVQAGRSRFRLPTYPADDYPRMESGKEQRVSVTLNGHRLAQMIDQVSPSMAVSDVRQVLNGMLFTLMDGGLWLVTTDGHRLSVDFEPVDGLGDIPPVSVIVPRKTALLAKKLLGQDGTVKIALCDKDVSFSFADGSTIFGKGILGLFPDWRRVLPKTPNSCRVDLSHLRNAVAMIDAVIAGSDKKDVLSRGIEVRFSGTTCVLSKQDAGHAEVEIGTSVSECAIGINLDYLRDALGTLPSASEHVQIGYGVNGNSAITVTPANQGYPLTVVMPMKL